MSEGLFGIRAGARRFVAGALRWLRDGLAAPEELNAVRPQLPPHLRELQRRTAPGGHVAPADHLPFASTQAAATEQPPDVSAGENKAHSTDTAPTPAEPSPPAEPAAGTCADATAQASLIAELDADPEADRLYDAIVETLHTVFDPEIPVDIYELGLIYGIDVDADRAVQIFMTLTSPNCPSAQALPAEVHEKVASLNGVTDVKVDIVWEPPWSPALMSEEARLELNM